MYKDMATLNRIPFLPWKLIVTGPDDLRIEFEITETAIDEPEQTLTCKLGKWQIVGPDIRTAQEVLRRLSDDLPEEAEMIHTCLNQNSRLYYR
jgi:hypothetical protein